MTYTRREVTKLAVSAIPGAVLLQAPKPNSKVRGVQIAMNAPYNFGSNNMSADETLARCVRLGISAVELRSQPVESYLGVLPELVTAAAPGGRNATRTPEQVANQKAAADELLKWRLSVPMAGAQAFRKRYEDAGVADRDREVRRHVRAVRRRARLLFHAREEPWRARDLMRDRCRRHEARGPVRRQASADGRLPRPRRDRAESLEGGVQLRRRTTAPTSTSATSSPAVTARRFPFLTEHHARITHVHVKDRKLKNGPNVPFGDRRHTRSSTCSG